jgi:hypothetical protein
MHERLFKERAAFLIFISKFKNYLPMQWRKYVIRPESWPEILMNYKSLIRKGLRY